MKRSDESAGHRHARLEELILEELRGLFRDDVSDPALGSVRITGLVLSVDYRNARVHYALAQPSADAVRLRVVESRLAHAIPFLRRCLGDALDLKRVPELRFIFDGVAPPEGP